MLKEIKIWTGSLFLAVASYYVSGYYVLYYELRYMVAVNVFLGVLICGKLYQLQNKLDKSFEKREKELGKKTEAGNMDSVDNNDVAQ